VALDASAGHHNALVRAARALHLKKHRQERRCFLIEGPACVEAALSSGVPIEHVFVAGDDPEREALADRARSAGHRVFRVDERTLKSIAQTQSPQGIVAVARFIHREPAQLGEVIGRSGPCFVVVLHHIGDPGNAGTLVRSADAFGASAVCCGSEGVDPYNDKVVRASMGSLFRIPLFIYDGWPSFAEAASGAGLTVVAADAGAPDVRSVTLPDRCALAIGHERHGHCGLPAADLAMRVGIPQHARTESLNAAVAGSIVLYEIARAAGCLPGPSSRTNDG